MDRQTYIQIYRKKILDLVFKGNHNRVIKVVKTFLAHPVSLSLSLVEIKIFSARAYPRAPIRTHQFLSLQCASEPFQGILGCFRGGRDHPYYLGHLSFSLSHDALNSSKTSRVMRYITWARQALSCTLENRYLEWHQKERS